MTPFRDIRRLLHLTRPFAGMYVVSIVALAVGSIAFLLIPPQLGRLIASLQAIQAGHDGRAAVAAGVRGAEFLVLHGIASLVYSFLASVASERIVNGLRFSFFSNLVNERLDRNVPKALGQIASEFASDLALIQDGLSTTLIDCIRHGLVAAGAFAGLCLIDIKMTTLALAGVALVAGALVLFIRRVTKSMIAIQEWRAKMMALLLEAASNVYIIQAYGRGEYMAGRFQSRLHETFSRVWRQMLLMASMNPVCLVLFAVVMSGVGAYGMGQLRGANLSISMLISYFTFAVVMVASISQVGYLGGRLRQAGAILAKHQRLLVPSAEPPRRTPDAPEDAPSGLRGPFGFDVRGVSFRYPGQESRAVSDVSFAALPGKLTAIVGESGGGKSTIAALLCGLYEPDTGSIRVLAGNTLPLDLEPADLGRQIAIVPQEPFLFAGTFLENITFGREWITEAEARRAASESRIHEFIMSLSDGYHTSVEEAGKNLSRGQRQRLAIARALAGNPSVIVLDEATASLDPASERAIKGVIDNLRGRATVIVIAHHGALLSDVDQCIVIRRGAVVSVGPLTDLPVEMGGVIG